MGLAGYKVADYYKAENRGVLISQIISLVVTIILAYILSLGVIQAIGGLKNANCRPNWTYIGADIGNAANLASYMDSSPTPTFPNLQSWGLGFVITAILVALRTFIPWWPLHPLAVLLPGLWPEYLKIGNSILIAFIIKLIVLKVGGTALYEKLTKPVAGIVGGVLIGRVLLLIATLFGGPLTY